MIEHDSAVTRLERGGWVRGVGRHAAVVTFFEVFASATFYGRFFWGGATILLKPVLLPLPHHTIPIYTGTGRGSGWQRRPSLFSQWYSGGLVTVCFYPSLCVGVGGGGRMGTTVMFSMVMHSRGHFSLNLL